MALYPPGEKFQRGEDRSQGNLDDSVATAMRAPNDLGYVSSILKKNKIPIFIRDYQTENASMEDLTKDLKKFAPTFIIISVTNSTIFDDILLCKKIRNFLGEVTIALKGAIFFNPRPEIFEQLNLETVDFLIGGEIEFIVDKLVEAICNPSHSGLSKVPSISFKKNGKWISTSFDQWSQDGDKIPFPDRKAINNELYSRPDSGRPLATIATSRGCGAKCTYCLTPIISGTRIRYRSPEKIFEEIKECYFEHGIKDFFFKSDTFTMNRRWVDDLCNFIVASDLNKKIQWVANSRVNPIEGETLKAMSAAGCNLVAFGFESGSEETLLKIKKGATVEQNIRARDLVKDAKMECFGFFLIGLPWEEREHLEKTKKLIFNLNCEYIEVHIATPYFGTKLYNDVSNSNLLDGSPLGKDYFNTPTLGTKTISIHELNQYRKSIILKYHTRPNFISKKILRAKFNPIVYLNYLKFGSRLLRNSLLVR